MNVLALCAGVGAMELGLELATRGAARPVCYVEREAYAAAVLVARMEDKALGRAPVWDDLCTFDARPWRGVVDLVTAGLPCQPYSVAGKQRGNADERALWPEFVRIVRECEPGAVFLENVPAFRHHFEPVWRELRRLGFEWAPPLLQTASESGAPHIRERFFAFAAHPQRGFLRYKPRWGGGESRRAPTGARLAGSDCPYPDREGLEGRGLSGCGRADQRTAGEVGRQDAHAHAHGRGREGEWCGWVFDAERQTLRHDPDGRGCGCRIGGSFWASESPVLRVDAGSPARVDELRTIGNVGAPPVVYANAWRVLTNG